MAFGLINQDLEKVYQASYERIVQYEEQQGDFFDKFYQNFLASSSEARDKFSQVDMKNQVTLIKNFLLHLQMYHKTKVMNERLKSVAITHGRAGYNISEHLYDLWLLSLLKTLEECDPKYTPKVKQAWKMVLKPGIDAIKSGMN